MNNVIIRRVSLSIQFQPLAAVRTVGNFTIRTPTGSGAVTLLCDDGVTQLQLDRGQQFTLEGINLADIKAKGNLGDFVMVLGATRVL